MMKHLNFIFGLSLLCLLVFYNNINAQIVVKIRPSRPKVVIVKPARLHAGHTWVDGHWRWHRKTRKYVWVKAHWVKERRGHAWVPGHWVKTPGGHKWVPGHWRRR